MNESLTDKLARLGGQTVNKLYDFAEATKTSYDIGASKKELDRLYQDLGKTFYEANENEDLPEYKEIFEKISGLREVIENYNPRMSETYRNNEENFGDETIDRDPFYEAKKNIAKNNKSMDDIASAFKKQMSENQSYETIDEEDYVIIDAEEEFDSEGEIIDE